MSKASNAAKAYATAVDQLERARSWVQKSKSKEGMFHVKVSWNVASDVEGYGLLSDGIAALAELRLRQDFVTVIEEWEVKIDKLRQELAEAMKEEADGRAR